MDTIRAIIFDLDNVLVSSRLVHYEAFAEALLQIKNINLSWHEHEEKYDGLSTKKKLEIMVNNGIIADSEQESISTLKQQLTKNCLPKHISPSERIRGLLITLRGRGYKIACASNAIRNSVEESLVLLGVRDLFDFVLSNDDVIEPKPSPEIYIKTMSRLNVQPTETLILEDSPHGRAAAYASGAHVLEIVDPLDTTIEKINDFLANKCISQPSPTIHVVIPMAGLGSRFAVAGYRLPKPFIDVRGKPMIFWVIDNMKSSKYKLKFHFIMRQEHINNYGFEEKLAAEGIDATFHPVQQTTEGAACSVLLAKEHINSSDPLVIINSDQYLDIHIDEFYTALMNPAYHGIISTFWQPNKDDIKWSYAALDKEGLVTDVREKTWIGPNATTGLYGWARGVDFVKYAEQMITNNVRTNGEFYVAPVYNEVIKEGTQIRTHLCKKMYGLGVPADLEYFLENYKSL